LYVISVVDLSSVVVKQLLWLGTNKLDDFGYGF